MQLKEVLLPGENLGNFRRSENFWIYLGGIDEIYQKLIAKLEVKLWEINNIAL